MEQNAPESQAPASSPKKPSLGGAIAIIVILLVVVVGAFYVLGNRTDAPAPVVETEEEVDETILAPETDVEVDVSVTPEAE